MDSDEVKLLLLILEQLEQRKPTMAANIQSKLGCLKERSDSYLGCKRCCDTQRISRSIFHKEKVFSGHLRVFSHLSSVSSSHFSFTPSPQSQEVEEVSPELLKKDEEGNVRTE